MRIMVERPSLERFLSGFYEKETVSIEINGDLKNRILRSFLSDDFCFLE